VFAWKCERCIGKKTARMRQGNAAARFSRRWLRSHKSASITLSLGIRVNPRQATIYSETHCVGMQDDGGEVQVGTVLWFNFYR
jgi:hypothetical protein